MSALGATAPSARHVLTSLRYLAEAVDAKDPYTRGHMDRVARYSMKTLECMRDTPVTDELREQLLAAALLHDIGKLRVPDAVLKKPGRLDALERLEIELHPVHACAILGSDELAAWIGPVIRAHHEKLDGTGYPDGLRRDEIPLAARIIAVADVFDACTSKRVYRRDQQAFSDADAIAILDEAAREEQLDAEVVEAFKVAYATARVSLARAASYAYSASPLSTSTGGEERPPLAIARAILEKARETAGQPPHTTYRIAARLATIANLQGDSEAALEYAREAEPRAEKPSERDRVALQKGLALREQGRLVEAEGMLTPLAAREDDDWLRGTANAMLAKIAMSKGELHRAETPIRRAAEACERMRRKLADDAERSPLAVTLRWWNADRQARLEATVELLEERRARRLGLAVAGRAGRAASERFEAIGSRVDAGKARAELARHFSDRGELDRAIFMLERERACSRDIGDRLSFLHHSIWLSEACSRKAACQPHSAASADLEARGLRVLEEARALLEETRRQLEKTRDKPGETPAQGVGDPALSRRIDVALALAHWCAGRLTEAGQLARRTLSADLDGGEPATVEPWLVARFLVLASDGDAEGLVDLGMEADREHHAIRAVECLAEAARISSNASGPAADKLTDLLGRMDRRCWLAAHPAYRSCFG